MCGSGMCGSGICEGVESLKSTILRWGEAAGSGCVVSEFLRNRGTLYIVGCG